MRSQTTTAIVPLNRAIVAQESTDEPQFHVTCPPDVPLLVAVVVGYPIVTAFNIFYATPAIKHESLGFQGQLGAVFQTQYQHLNSTPTLSNKFIQPAETSLSP